MRYEGAKRSHTTFRVLKGAKIQCAIGSIWLEMYTTVLPRSQANNFHKRFHKVNSKAARVAGESFHSQIRSNLHNFSDFVPPSSVPLYSTACLNAHSLCVGCWITLSLLRQIKQCEISFTLADRIFDVKCL